MPLNRHVFLDTQVFEQELYDTKSRRLLRLKDLVKDGHANIVITEITEREIIARIQQTTTAALQAVTRCRKSRETGILRQLDSKFAPVFDKHDTTALSKEIERKFRKYCKDADIEVLPLSLTGKTYASIVDDYFALRPPFKEGKKRSEFLDAIAAAILKKWRKKRDVNVYVVTDDCDWEGICTKQLTLLKSLNDFFSLFPDQNLSKLLVAGIEGPNVDYLRGEIAKEFGRIDFFLDGVDGRVEKVEDIKVELGRTVIVEAEKGRAIAEIDCSVSFDAAIEYEFEWQRYCHVRDDYDTQHEHGTDQVHTATSFTVEVTFKYDEKDPAALEDLEGISLDTTHFSIDCGAILERGY